MAGFELFSRNGRLETADGQRFCLKGANWFGFETELAVVHGLWCRPLAAYLDLLQAHGFNALRLPFAAELALAPPGAFMPNGIDYSQNPGLQGLASLQVMDVVVAEAAKRGIVVLLDMHRLTGSGSITPLWHDAGAGWPEERVTEAWRAMAARYAAAWNVVGADLKNEPHGAAAWGSGCRETDWRGGAQRLGEAVLAVNPRLLIFVEGTSGNTHPVPTTEAAFWGGSLAAARAAPLHLSVPDKLVWSPHVYGPDVHMQDYFRAPGFPANMPAIWTRQWAFLAAEPPCAGAAAAAFVTPAVPAVLSGAQTPKGGAIGNPSLAPSWPAVVIGEWGGRQSPGGADRAWARAFASFLAGLGAMDTFFWCLNPNSGDTGGLLKDDWATPEDYKLGLLAWLCPAPSRLTHAPGGVIKCVTLTGDGASPKSRTARPAERPAAPAVPAAARRLAEPPAGSGEWDTGAPACGAGAQHHSRTAQAAAAPGEPGAGNGGAARALAQAGAAAAAPAAAQAASSGAAAGGGFAGLQLAVAVVNGWHDGQQAFHQADLELWNSSSSAVPSACVAGCPPATLHQCWNCTQASAPDGTCAFGFPEWLTTNGGLQPGQSWKFGGIFKGGAPPPFAVLPSG